jgi:hypothetical protein
MLKKVLIGLGVLSLVLILLFFYANHRNRTLSPPGKAEWKANGFEILLNYNRPAVRERLIFGTEAQGALQPYGKYWRLGANEATEVTFNQKVLFNGVALKAGTYRLYAIPGENSFQIGVNMELGKWGAFEPDYSQDLLTTEVAVTKLEVPVEMFTARIVAGTESTAIISFEWSDVQINIPIGLESGI